ncbi:hypothetical protein FXB90_04365 [Aggregatibacter actinomycetemcomitans]|nr:hypothetical protein FXB90_04365 [Aggregatibacter actinomycetemcomitans]
MKPGIVLALGLSVNSQLRESGSIEQDASQIIMLFPWFYALSVLFLA